MMKTSHRLRRSSDEGVRERPPLHSELHMIRRRAASRRENWFGRMRQHVADSPENSAFLEMIERSVQQAFIATGDEDVAEDLAHKALWPVFLEIQKNPELLNDPATLE